MRTSKAFSVSLSRAVASALELKAKNDGLSPGLKIADIVEAYFVDGNHPELPKDAKADLQLLRRLRDKAIEKMEELNDPQAFQADITLRTFQACQSDPEWLRDYEKYIRGDSMLSGNDRKTNANQTIGSRIKSKLEANDLCDASGKPQRGRAPAGTIVQTYQLLRLP